MKRCNSCWTINADQNTKCSKCGADINETYTFICNKCGKVLSDNETVCPKCGTERILLSETQSKKSNSVLQNIKNNKVILCVTIFTFIISWWCSYKYFISSYQKQAKEHYNKSMLPLITEIPEKIYKKQNRDIGYVRIQERTSAGTEPTSNASWPYEVHKGDQFEILNFVVPGNIGKTVQQKTIKLSNGEVVNVESDSYISFNDEQIVVDGKSCVKCKYWKNGSFKDIYLPIDELKEITKTDKYWVQVIPYFFKQKLWIPLKSGYWTRSEGGNYYE